jgi:hypothetical protein
LRAPGPALNAAINTYNVGVERAACCLSHPSPANQPTIPTMANNDTSDDAVCKNMHLGSSQRGGNGEDDDDDDARQSTSEVDNVCICRSYWLLSREAGVLGRPLPHRSTYCNCWT